LKRKGKQKRQRLDVGGQRLEEEKRGRDGEAGEDGAENSRPMIAIDYQFV
jgi:hypothetical protein